MRWLPMPESIGPIQPRLNFYHSTSMKQKNIYANPKQTVKCDKLHIDKNIN